MSPLEEYNGIVHYRQQNKLTEGEVHHIIPRKCGGPDVGWNRVMLTTAEHIRCHRLLCSIYAAGVEHDRMATAYCLMVTSREGVVLSDEEAAEARKMASSAKRGHCPLKAWRPGHTPWNKGKKGLQHHTEEWKRHNAEVLTGRKRSQETRKKISDALKGKPKPWLKGKPKPEEWKAKMRGRTPWNKGKKKTA